ncbi:MAG: glycosyltransferase [Proteobacteria bacterium]|nr:glycosyltransferase [Pseudomonadota bacterium]MBU1595520.1 glycosyltransferase [Pseudomonadota bacterium]
MRILHIAKYFPPHLGGMETFLDQLTREQAASGEDVLVLAHAGPEPAGTSRPVQGLEVRRAPVLLNLGGYAPMAPALPLMHLHALRRFRPDVIHAHAPNVAALWPALLHGRAPLVLHWHADVQFPPDRRPPALALALACWKRLEALMLKRAEAVIATSQAYLDSSPALAGHRQKCRVAPLGLTESPVARPGDHPALRFLDGRTDGSGLRVLAVGRLAHYKGFAHLCEAVRQTPEASLCLVGEGEERARLEALASLPEVRGRIHLAGAVPDDVLDGCYRRSHVLCLPSLSRSEAFGMVLLEAMSRSLPCIATTVPGSGMSEVVRHGETGLLVRPGSVQELAQALGRLALSPELRLRLGQAGRERFLGHYTLPEVARRIRTVYDAALAPSPGT